MCYAERRQRAWGAYDSDGRWAMGFPFRAGTPRLSYVPVFSRVCTSTTGLVAYWLLG